MSRRHYTISLATALLEKVRQFFLFFLPMLLILLVAGSIHFYSDYEIRRQSIKNAELLNIQLAEQVVTVDISRIVSDLLFIADYLNRSIHVAELTPEYKREVITTLFEGFAKNKQIYDQLRYIDHHGIEQIRINYRNKEAITVPERELQDKSARYYVQQGLQLHNGEIYLSPMDLNIEAGEIEIPHKPVIRFVTPIISPHGKTEGIIVLNYLGNELIQNFRRAVTAISERVHLVNSKGFWLSHTDPSREWGFMFNNHSGFFNSFNHEWNKIRNMETGQFVTPNGLFSHLAINPLQVAQDRAGIDPQRITPSTQQHYQWHIIAHLPSDKLESTPIGFLQQNRQLYIVILLFILILSWVLAHNSLRRRQFELHRANELRFRDTLEEIQLAALTITPEGRVLFCNNHLQQLLNRPLAEIVDNNFQRFIPSEERQDVLQFALNQNTQGNKHSSYHESHIVNIDGDLRLIAWTSTTVLNEQDQVESITYIGHDITEQNRTRETLTKLVRAAEQSPAVIMITDTAGAIDYVNPKFTELTGYSFDEVKGKNPRILKSGETFPEEYRDLWTTIAHGKEWRGTLHNRKKNGELYWESALISPIRNEEGTTTHFLSVKEDITARIALEEEVKQHQEELDRARTFAVVGRMASMVAHDLRNPLSSIKMGLQILSKKPDHNPEEQELCEIGLEQIRYMENILDGLLAYSRPDKLELSWINLDKLIDTAVSAIQNQINELQITITTHSSSTLPTVEVDKLKIRRVLNNLLSNAVDAIREGQPEAPAITITITTSLDLGNEGPFILLEICDNGSGIDDQQEPASLFEPFVTTRSKGTGLGLAIVKRIIDQHQGSITLLSQKLQGACALITLPINHSEPSLSSENISEQLPEPLIQTSTIENR